MHVEDLAFRLNAAFPPGSEDLVSWAVVPENETIINSAFLRRNTGLFLIGAEEIKRIATGVFISDEVVESLLHMGPGTLFLTHHNFNYHEDARGLEAVSAETLTRLKAGGVSIFVAHASLDTHPDYGTSVALARRLEIEPQEWFYDYFGAPVALIGEISPTTPEALAEKFKHAIESSSIILHKHSQTVRKVVVVAGGGDIPELLEEAQWRGCDTLIGGTIENRWMLPFIQETNQKFLNLNQKLGLNLLGGGHYATERPAMQDLTSLLQYWGLPVEFIEDHSLLLTP